MGHDDACEGPGAGRRRRRPVGGLDAELDPFLACEVEDGGRDDLFDGEW